MGWAWGWACLSRQVKPGQVRSSQVSSHQVKSGQGREICQSRPLRSSPVHPCSRCLKTDQDQMCSVQCAAPSTRRFELEMGTWEAGGREPYAQVEGP